MRCAAIESRAPLVVRNGILCSVWRACSAQAASERASRCERSWARARWSPSCSGCLRASWQVRQPAWKLSHRALRRVVRSAQWTRFCPKKSRVAEAAAPTQQGTAHAGLFLDRVAVAANARRRALLHAVHRVDAASKAMNRLRASQKRQRGPHRWRTRPSRMIGQTKSARRTSRVRARA